MYRKYIFIAVLCIVASCAKQPKVPSVTKAIETQADTTARDSVETVKDSVATSVYDLSDSDANENKEEDEVNNEDYSDDFDPFEPHEPMLEVNAKKHTKTYINERFDFKFVYPDYLLNDLEAGNCDGCSFFNKNKTLEITVCGSNFLKEDYDLQQYLHNFEQILKDDGVKILSAVYNKTNCVIMGKKGKRKYFERHFYKIIEDNFSVMHSIRILYTRDKDLKTLQRLNDWF